MGVYKTCDGVCYLIFNVKGKEWEYKKLSTFVSYFGKLDHMTQTKIKMAALYI